MTCKDLFIAPAARDFSTSGLEPLSVNNEFIGENQPGGVWVKNSKKFFGNSVKVNRVLVKTRYLNKSEISKSLASISSDGRLISSFKDISFIYVVTASGELRVWPTSTNQTSFSRTKHSSLSAGETVLIAGRIELDGKGKLWLINNKSGHYTPPVQHLNWYAQHLQKITDHQFKVQDESNRFR